MNRSFHVSFSRLLLLVCCLLTIVPVRSQQPKLILPIGHTNAVYTASFSSDGKKIATSSWDGTAKIWDVQSGTLLVDLRGHTDQVITTCFSPDDTKVLTASDDKTAKIWDAQNGTLLADLKGHAGKINSACFSPDGKMIVTASDDNTAKIWDVKSGKRLVELSGHTDAINSACFSHDSKEIVTASDDSTAKIWNASNGALLADLKGHHSRVNGASFSYDRKKIITVSRDHTKTVKLWDAVKGKFLFNLKGYNDDIANGASFSPDGEKIVTFSLDGTSIIWAAKNGNLLVELKGHADIVNSAFFSPDGKKIITASDDSSAKIWDATSGKLLIDLKGHTDIVWRACFSNDGKKVVTASRDQTAKIWDAVTGVLIADAKGHTHEVINAFFSNDGKKMATTSRDHTAKIWDVESGMLVANLQGHTDLITIVSFSPDGKKLATASYDHTAKIWDAESGALIADLNHTSGVSGCIFSPDGYKVVTTAALNDTINIWDATNGALLAYMAAGSTGIGSNCFSSDSKRIITPSYDSTARIWDATNGALLAELKGHTGKVNTACFSSDGKKILTTCNNTVKIWNALSGLVITELKGTNACFSPDGNKVVITTYLSDTAKIWDAQTGILLSNVVSDSEEISTACFSVDGKKILTSGWSHYTAEVWDAQSGALLSDLKTNADLVTGRCFSSDGKKIATISNDNTVKIQDADNGRLVYTVFALDSTDYFTQIPTGYYQCSPKAAKLLHYVDDDLKVITFEQLDVRYNRPDLVLEAIGNPDTDLIKSYKKAWQKRITKLGFDSGLFTGGFHVPEADIQNRDSIQYGQTSNKLSLQIKAKDTSVMLDRYNVWINEVPLFGIKGISLKSRNTKHFDTTIIVTLSNGSNRIEASVTNVGGLESYRIPLDVKYTSPDTVREKLYFVGIGIDHFNDSSHNLRWSVKDIHNLVRNFKRKYGAACIIDTLFNNKVSIENVKALKQRLLATTENDKVIVAYSGHGLLSKDFDYFLSTYNVSFGEPEKAGLPYETLEDLLDGIPARKKLMLIDACHSGEVDKEELSKMVEVQGELDSTQKGGTPLIDTTHKKLGTKNSFELMQEVFVNVGRNTGATVISAASGTQFALEMDGLKNGVFTHSILELMKKNTTVTISELKKYVNQRVTELTHGVQVPTSRDENKVMDWEVW